MTRSLSPFLVLAAVAVFTAGCSHAGPSPAGPAANPQTTALALSGIVWKLQSLQRADATSVPVSNPEQFTIEIGADGRLTVRADCNRCSGAYSQTGDALRVNPIMACTRAACSTAPFDGEYVSALADATMVSTGSNTLELKSKVGLLRFSR